MLKFRIISSLFLIFAFSMAIPSKAGEPIKKTASVLVSTPVGAFVGLGRGAVSKGIQYADAFSNDFGEGVIPKLIGIPGGLFVGGIAGGVTGFVRGAIDGVRISTQDPFSAEAMSLDGNFLDFDPYDFSGTY